MNHKTRRGFLALDPSATFFVSSSSFSLSTIYGSGVSSSTPTKGKVKNRVPVDLKDSQYHDNHHHRLVLWIDQLFLQHLIMCYRCAYFAFITLPRMIFNGIRLLLFVLCLLPGFVQFAYYYWFVADRVSVQYGTESARQTLDVYRCRPASGESSSTASSSDHPPSIVRRGLRPVVVFCPGGAWLIGYKMWGALTARALTAAGMVVACPDYRNYPWSTVPGMVSDVSVALQWIIDHVQEHGGDPCNVVVVGQSAGGHLAFTALLRQALGCNRSPAVTAATGTPVTPENLDDVVVSSPVDDLPTYFTAPSSRDEELLEEEGRGSVAKALLCPNNSCDIPAEPTWMWEATDFKGFIALSAPFDLTAMSRSFQKHGLDKHIVDRIFGCDVSQYDPRWLLDNARTDVPLRLPPMRVYHGDADKTVPTCDDFCLLLQQRLEASAPSGASVATSPFTYTIYPGWSHTDAIIEGPMMANHTFHRDLFDAVVEWTCRASSPATSFPPPPTSSAPGTVGIVDLPSSDVLPPMLEWPDDTHPALRPLCPSCLVNLGRFFMPF
jgi:prenylcysteine alpha-carboxyl methylesterase